MFFALMLVMSAGNDAMPAVKPFFTTSLLLAAHRGGAYQWPESTIEGFKLAVTAWPDILLESDARVTADGQVVLLHDARVDRTTDGTGEVAGMSLEQVKALDAGYRFTSDGGKTFPYRGKGIKIPTFAEALTVFPDSRFLIELKNQPGCAEAVVDVIHNCKAVDRVALASTNASLMAAAQQREPNVIRCYNMTQGVTLLAELRGASWQSYKPVADMLAIESDLIDQYNLTPEEIHAIRDKGIAILVYTINNIDAMRKYIDIGVTSILTDKPDLLAGMIK